MADKPTGIVSPEIEKLSEKLQKDPNSKMFFNLAEEYYKGGMIEEAFIVLQTGLKSHPTYLSAKVLLGKIYLDQNKTREAKEIFEQILKVNPDNIIVNKKLAIIYIDENLLNEAEKCCNQILFFNSKDSEALTLLQKVKNLKNAPVKLPIEGQKVESRPVQEIPEEKHESIKPAKPDESVKVEAPSTVRREKEKTEAVIHPISSAQKTIGKASSSVSSTAPPAQPEKTFDFSDIMKEEEVKPPQARLQPSENGKVKIKENLDTMVLAELYIKQGHYDKGIEIYQKLLEQDPFNETVRQQLEDAKNIGNLLGAKNQPNGIEKNILETIIPSVDQSSSDRVHAPPPVLSSQKQAKIARLKQWLELLKKVH